MANDLQLKNDDTTLVATTKTLDDGTRHWMPGVTAWATALIDGANTFEIPLAAALADAKANPASILVGACGLVFNGTTWDRARGDTTNGLDVDVTRVQGNVTVVGTGTFAVQVDAALPAGDNNIGNVDVLTLPPEVHSADFDTGAGTDTTLCFGIALPASGGAVAGGTASNPLRTDPTGATTQPVSNAGTFAVQLTGAGLTALQLIDNLVMIDNDTFTAGGGSIGVVGFLVDEVLVGTVNEDFAGAARMSANRNQYIQIRDGAASAERGAAVDASNRLSVAVGNTVTVSQSGNVTVVGTGTFAVQIDAALPAGDNNIGNVDVVSQTPGTGATNLGKAVDAVAGGADVGVALLAVRDDTLSALTPTDGDYTHVRVNSQGALHVTGGGGGTQYAVDDALGVTPTGTLAVVRRKDTPGSLGMNPAEDDAVDLRCDDSGRLWVTGPTTLPATYLAAGTLNELDYHTGVGTVNQPLIGIALPGAGGPVAGGTSTDPVRVDPTGTTTQPVSGTVTADAGSGTFAAGGVAAHDAAVSGNPIRIAAKSNDNEPTAVSADGDTVDLWADRLGRLVTVDAHPTQSGPVTVNKTAAAISDVIGTPGAGQSLYVRRVWVSNNDAAKVRLTLSDGATAKAVGTLAADGGGVMMDFGSAGWKLTADTALRATLSGAGDVDINVLDYYVAP